MKEYWLTIITPTYNAESCIEQTIYSVSRSKDEDIEYIIIDGGSNDRTSEIIKKFDHVVDFFCSEKDNGIYDALNKGIKKAHGNYVMMLAAGDCILDGTLKELKKILNPTTDIFCGTIVHHSDVGFQYVQSEKNLEQLRIYCSLRHPASLFKRSRFERYGYYDTQYRCAGDREIFLRWYLSGVKFQIEDFPLVLFESGNGISTADPTKHAIPEDVHISKLYNTPDEMIRKHTHTVMSHIFPPFWKKTIRWILIKTYLYQTIIKLTGKNKRFVTQEELVKYGIQGVRKL